MGRSSAAFLVLAAIGAAATAVLYFVTRPKAAAAEESIQAPEFPQGAYPTDDPFAPIGSGAPTGVMRPPIVQETPHYTEPGPDIPEDYAVLAELERQERKECPWDNSIFATISACDHHIIDVHGGAPNEDRSGPIPGSVPLLRYQKIPFLLRVRDNTVGRNPVINQFVELKRPSGEVVQADYTDANGCIDFLNLDPGTYRVVIDALPTYSQVDLSYDVDFLPERVTLYDFSGNPVEMEFMRPYLINIRLDSPGWSVIEERAITGEVAPGPVPLDSVNIVDSLNAARFGYPVLALKIGRFDAKMSDGSDITTQELTLIGTWRG